MYIRLKLANLYSELHLYEIYIYIYTIYIDIYHICIYIYTSYNYIYHLPDIYISCLNCCLLKFRSL